MKIFSLLAGTLMIAVGIVAIAGADLCDAWQWLLAGVAVVVGLAGIASAATRREP